MVRLSEENIGAIQSKYRNPATTNSSDTLSDQLANHAFQNGNKNHFQNGCMPADESADYDSAAVLVRSSTKPMRNSPSYDGGGCSMGSLKDQYNGGDSSIEAGCEILCLKFLPCSEEQKRLARGKITS